MGTPASNPYLYFMFSTEHANKKNTVEGKLGKRFECGTVVVNGKKKKYSYVSTNKTVFLKEYPDAKVVAEGYDNKMTYTECNTVAKRGN